MSKTGSSFSFSVGKDSFLFRDADAEEGFKFPSDKKILALDLDKTLIFSSKSEFKSAEFLIKLTIDGVQQPLYLSKRPNLIAFLKELSKHYTIVIFTVAIKQYAEVMLRSLKIDEYISFLYHRGHCLKLAEGNYMKDLTTLKVSLDRVILIDDSPYNTLLQPQNCLVIPAFNGERQDRELTKLLPFLVELAGVSDVRDVGKKYSQYNERAKSMTEMSSEITAGDKKRVRFVECKGTPEMQVDEDCDFTEVDEGGEGKLCPRISSPVKLEETKTILIRAVARTI